MKKHLFIALLFFGRILNTNAQAQLYIEKYKPICDTLSNQFQIPSSVILGVAMIESGNGQGRTAKLLNNHFGIVGPNNLRKTHHIKTRYRQYDSDTASFSSFCRLVASKKFYNNLKGDSNVYIWLTSIGHSGYCRYPRSWAITIINQLKKYGLLNKNVTPPVNWEKPLIKKHKKGKSKTGHKSKKKKISIRKIKSRKKHRRRH